MTTINGYKYRGIKRFVDRHGKTVRYYLRSTGKALPDPADGFRQFDQAYWDAVTGIVIRKPKRMATRSGPETVEKAIRDYLRSPVLASLAPDTQASRTSLLKLWAKDVGTARLSTLRSVDIEAGIKRRTPTTGKNWLYAVRALIQWCISEGRYDIKTDPTQGVKLKPVAPTEGWVSWTEADVAQFVKRWPKGTMQYRALMVLLCSGQRRSDVVKFGWHMVEDGGIRFVQQKTGKRMLLPIAPSLAEALPPRPHENVIDLKPTPFLLTPGQARPFRAVYFTQWFGEACQEAGLDLSPHGTRKLAAQTVYRTALRAGRTDAIAITMAFTGHNTERQLRVYLGENFEQEEYAGELVAFMR